MPPSEAGQDGTFAGHLFLFTFKEGEKCNGMNMLNISMIPFFAGRRNRAKRGVMQRSHSVMMTIFYQGNNSVVEH